MMIFVIGYWRVGDTVRMIMYNVYYLQIEVGNKIDPSIIQLMKQLKAPFYFYLIFCSQIYAIA